MQYFLQFRLPSHALLTVTGCFARGRIQTGCAVIVLLGLSQNNWMLFCKVHCLIAFEATVGSFFTSDTNTMTFFFGQKDSMQVFSFVLEFLEA